VLWNGCIQFLIGFGRRGPIEPTPARRVRAPFLRRPPQIDENRAPRGRRGRRWSWSLRTRARVTVTKCRYRGSPSHQAERGHRARGAGRRRLPGRRPWCGWWRRRRRRRCRRRGRHLRRASRVLSGCHQGGWRAAQGVPAVKTGLGGRRRTGKLADYEVLTPGCRPHTQTPLPEPCCGTTMAQEGSRIAGHMGIGQLHMSEVDGGR
jgi:hypothetical protein